MVIGIDCRLWNQTGVGRYTKNLVRELSQIDKKNQYVLFVRPQDRTQVQNIIKTSNFKIQDADIRWHSLAEQLKFTQILNQQNLDIMHFPYFSHPISYNRPFIVTIHDLIINHFPTGRASTLPLPFYYLKRFGYQKVLNHAVRNSKKIIVPLNCVKDDLMRTLNVPAERIAVTVEGFDASIAKGEVSNRIIEASKIPYFLYVGNAYPHKNLDNLIEGFESANLRNLNMILVGKKDFFYKRLEKKKKSSNILFFHDVSDAELFHLYSKSIAAVSASLMEGFGLLPLEAFGAGTIPVVSDIPAFREVCDENAIYFDQKDSNDISKKLRHASDLNNSEREKIIKGGKELLKKFSWRKMAEETLKVYQTSI